MSTDAPKSNYQPAPEFTEKRSWGCWIFAAILGMLGFCLFPATGGLAWLIEGPFTLALGWIMFLVHNVPQMRPGGEQFAIWLVGVVLLTIGGQWVGTRMVQARRRQLSEQEVEASGAIAEWRFGWTVLLVLVVHAMFISGLALTGLLQQTYWVATSPEPLLKSNWTAHFRNHSNHNLKQLGLASHNYHDRFGQFPQSTFSTKGRPLHSWITLSLPFLEHQAIYETIDLDKPWNDPAQSQVFETRMESVENRGIRKQPPEDQPAPAHYAANQHLIGPQLTTKFADITDGTSNTILYGEVVTQIPAWGEPANWRDPADGINQTSHGFGSPFEGGAQFTFVDGSVQFLRDDIDPAVLKALSTPAGREPDHERY